MRRLTDTLDSAADVGVTAEVRAWVLALTMRHALTMALIAAACWYAIWLVFPLNLSAWIGLAVFVAAFGVGYLVASRLMQRRVAEETQRRRDLVKVAENYRK
ncbi:MAG: hypothetical protein ACRECO_07955 [Xanthobacteraceae bacterium]